MERYLQHLFADIDRSIAQAPPPPEHDWLDVSDDDDEPTYDCSGYIKIGDLTGIPPEAFPPESKLDDSQLTQLLLRLQKLWKAWHLYWETPHHLPERRQYDAMLRQMSGESIRWNFETGGEVKICRFEEGGYCPFQPGDDYCYCRHVEDSVKHDIALWEEYVRSQGLDPYREKTQDEENAFEEEMQARDLKKMYGDDWFLFLYPDFIFDDDPEEMDWKEMISEEDDFLGEIDEEDYGNTQGAEVFNFDFDDWIFLDEDDEEQEDILPFY